MRHVALAGMAAWLGIASVWGQEPPVVLFDTGQADAILSNGRWQLVANGRAIKDLGANEAEARKALQVIRRLGLNQYGVIGTPKPVLEYWLSDGHAPRGFADDLQRTPFDAASLRVEVWQNQWCLRDVHQVLFVFGPHEADARQALAMLRRHEFNQVGYVGQTAPVLMCFLNDPKQASSPAHPPSNSTKIWAAKKPANPPMPPGMLTVRQLGGGNPLQMAFLQGGDWQPINWRQAEIRNDSQGWKLFAGQLCLADFGPREEEARAALGAVRFYRFTEQVRVGEGPTPFTFFLSNGQAPHGIWPGLRSVSFRPELLAAQPTRGTWMICQNGQPLIDGGSSPEQAKHVLQIIRQFRFDTLSQIGEDGQGMRFLTRNW